MANLVAELRWFYFCISLINNEVDIFSSLLEISVSVYITIGGGLGLCFSICMQPLPNIDI